MTPAPGTYALLLRCDAAAQARVGRWGRIDLSKGFYIYTGSAFGPGGVRARVSRHFRKRKRMHWHIDYLRVFLLPLEAWYSHDGGRLEHRWARLFAEMDAAVSVAGLGCSDCDCRSHLFHFPNRPSYERFAAAAGAGTEIWARRGT